MATQTDQRAPQSSSTNRQNEESQQYQQQHSLQRNWPQSYLAPRRGSRLGFGLSPFEFLSSNPFSLMRRMNEEMDRVFQEFGLERGNRGGWAPAIEVAEQDGRYNVRAELPGIRPDDVKVEIENDQLVLHGERKEEHEEKQGGTHRTERQYGFFYRAIPLPEGADAEHANAKFENGLLEVSIPVPQQKQNRRSIPVEGQGKQQGQRQAA